jgi:hypothetical protein
MVDRKSAASRADVVLVVSTEADLVISPSFRLSLVPVLSPPACSIATGRPSGAWYHLDKVPACLGAGFLFANGLGPDDREAGEKVMVVGGIRDEGSRRGRPYSSSSGMI